MLRRVAVSLAIMLAANMTSDPSFAKDTLWSPSDFQGAWVTIDDQVENGCWTNIGEVKKYATDQLDLAGFKTTEAPQEKSDGAKLIFEKDRVTLYFKIEGTRWPSGMCVGSVLVYFLGSAVPRHDDENLIISPIGYPGARSIWDKKNFNTLSLDLVKHYISKWVEDGIIVDSKK